MQCVARSKALEKRLGNTNSLGASDRKGTQLELNFFTPLEKLRTDMIASVQEWIDLFDEIVFAN